MGKGKAIGLDDVASETIVSFANHLSQKTINSENISPSMGTNPWASNTMRKAEPKVELLCV